MYHTKPKKTKVFWSDQEQELVAQEAVKLSLASQEFIWTFAAKAQKILPTSRQRWINGKSNVNK